MSTTRKLWSSISGFCLACSLVSTTVAQEEIFSLGMQLGSGARAIGMGGAFTSLGGDFSASLWNPAALSDIRRVEVFGSFSHLMRRSSTDLLSNSELFNGGQFENDANFTKFNDLGLAYPLPTIRGSLVFAFGFNRVRSYDSNFDFRTFNASEDDQVNQAWKEIENGGLNAWTLSGAVDVSPNMSVGLGLNFWTGGTDFQSTFHEVDVDDIYTFNAYTLEENLNSDVTGFNVKAGGLFKLSRAMRIGATIATPITFNIEENWSSFDETLFDDDTFSDSLESGFFEYKLRSPFTFTGGASLHFLNFVLSGDVEFNDWSQIRYKSEPPLADLSENEANRLISDNYRATTRLRLGGEFTLPMTGISLRAGYFRDPSVLQNADPDEDKQFLSAGLGFLVDKQARLDLAYVHGFWKRFNSGLPGTGDIEEYVEEIKVNKLFVSFAFRF